MKQTETAEKRYHHRRERQLLRQPVPHRRVVEFFEQAPHQGLAPGLCLSDLNRTTPAQLPSSTRLAAGWSVRSCLPARHQADPSP